MSFANLNLHPTLLKSLQQCGYQNATPIQEQAIPRILAGKDLIAIAQTGTGKTAAFALPILHQLLNAPVPTAPSILILAPVRELASQITDAIYKYSGHKKVRVANILGGMPYHAQIRQLKQGVDIIVATPGRLIDYLERGKVIDLSQIKTFVLDEADRMLDMGFIEDIKLISNFLPKSRQTLLFTATMDEAIVKLAQKILHQPEELIIPGKSVTLEKIKQSIYITDDVQHKHELLTHFLANENIFKAIIFTGTKHYAERLASYLRELGYSADVLHGDIKQQKRNRILREFHQGKIQFLVATDLAARGIDVRDITHVINFDLPRTGEDYVHRIGRTGRAGKSGYAISFVATNEITQLKRIERYIKNTLAPETIAGLEPKKPQRPAAPKPKNKHARRNSPARHRNKDFGSRGQSTQNDQNKSQHAGKKFKKPYSDKPKTDQPKKKFGFGSKPKKSSQAPHSQKPHGKKNFHKRPNRDHNR